MRESIQRPTLRLPEVEAAYQTQRQRRAQLGDTSCPLCRAPSIEEFHLWRLIPNEYPYGKIARTHHMLVPKRCVAEHELSPEEREELLALKRSLADRYHYYLEATPQRQSVPGHYHLHCLDLQGPCAHPDHNPAR